MMMDMTVVLVLVAVVVLAVTRLVYVLLTIQRGSPLILSQHEAVKTLVILGSGGHTVEMLKMVAALNPKKYSPRVYVVADTDRISNEKLLEVEKRFKGEGQFVVEVVPRSREVGQSWITSAFTSLHALIVSFLMLIRHCPALILANGPGTCVPLCAGAVVLRVLGVNPSRVVFVESLCRVCSLSFSGRLLYPLSDHFFVQWPQLTEKHPRAHYLGRLV